MLKLRLNRTKSRRICGSLLSIVPFTLSVKACYFSASRLTFNETYNENIIYDANSILRYSERLKFALEFSL